MILEKILILRKERHFNLFDKNSEILKTLFLYAYNSYWRLIFASSRTSVFISQKDSQNLFALLKDAYKRTFAFKGFLREVIVDKVYPSETSNTLIYGKPIPAIVFCSSRKILMEIQVTRK